jgi:hypothetical protein
MSKSIIAFNNDLSFWYCMAYHEGCRLDRCKQQAILLKDKYQVIENYPKIISIYPNKVLPDAEINLYFNDYYSYITNLEAYLKEYPCKICKKVFKKRYNLNVHKCKIIEFSTTRQCRNCHFTKDIELFSKLKSSKDGYDNYCINCIKNSNSRQELRCPCLKDIKTSHESYKNRLVCERMGNC